MQSNNPILTRVETYADYHKPMTVRGAINKSVLLTSISAGVGILFFLYCLLTQNFNMAMMGSVVGGIGGFILAMIITFKPNTAPNLAVPYALFEGAFLGGISVLFELKYPGAPIKALLATFITMFVMLALYKRKIIRATEKFKSVVMSATLAIFILFIAQFILKIVFGSSIPYVFESNGLGIGVAVFVAVIASLNLILDFDLIENAAMQRAPQSFEWICAVSLLATLIWMYTSFLRLIGLSSND